MIRCDRTVAWRALQGHFEAHGRDLDLREAFARDPTRFDAYAVQRAMGAILDELRTRFPDARPPLRALVPVLQDVSEQLARLGPFNFLLSDGEHLFARCATKLAYLVRQAPFGAAHLLDEELTIDFAGCTTPQDMVAVIATTPLTRNEEWTTMTPGQLLVFRDGQIAG